MRNLMVSCALFVACVSFGETVDVKVETLRADKSCKVETVSVEVKDGTAHFAWPRTRIPSDAVSVSVKPAFATARKGEAGYYVNPSGALCTFRLDKGHFAQHKNWFPMPVYGMKTPRATFVAIVTGMKYEFSLVADVKDGVYSCFTAFDMDMAHAYEDIEIDYVFLSGDDADYSGMARTYRRYQLARGACRPISERIKTNKALAYAVQAPEIRIRQAWKPAPSPVPDQTEQNEPPVTAYVTFDRVKEIIDACDAAGVGKAEYCLVGWNYRGHDGRWPQMFPVEPLLGGETKLRELVAYSLAKGHPIVGHANYRDAYLIADTFDFEYCQDRKDDGTMTDAKREAWSGGRCFRVCPRRAYEKYAIKHTAAMKALGFRGLGYIDVVSSRPLFPCTDPRHPLNNVERAVWEKAILRLQSDAFGGSASEGGFDWCIGDVDSALTVVFADPFNNLPSGKKWHPMIDRYVPFWQIVYHGIVLSTPFRTMWNIEAKPDKWRYRLCAAEYGNRPTFYYYGRWNRPDEPDIHCGTAEELESSVRIIKEGADDYAARSSLQYHFMERHDILGEGLARTTYSNGARLYVNYSDASWQVDGVSVPARDYLLCQGTGSSSK